MCMDCGQSVLDLRIRLWLYVPRLTIIFVYLSQLRCVVHIRSGTLTKRGASFLNNIKVPNLCPRQTTLGKNQFLPCPSLNRGVPSTNHYLISTFTTGRITVKILKHVWFYNSTVVIHIVQVNSRSCVFYFRHTVKEKTVV